MCEEPARDHGSAGAKMNPGRVEVVGDDAERLAPLVSQGRPEGTGRLAPQHPGELRPVLERALLGLLAVAEVPDDGRELSRPPVPELAHRQVHREGRAVLAAALRLAGTDAGDP